MKTWGTHRALAAVLALALALSFASPPATLGAGPAVSGTVRNAATNAPLSGIWVYLAGYDITPYGREMTFSKTVKTDAAGAYAFDAVFGDEIEMQAWDWGFGTASATYANPGMPVVKDFALTPFRLGFYGTLLDDQTGAAIQAAGITATFVGDPQAGAIAGRTQYTGSYDLWLPHAGEWRIEAWDSEHEPMIVNRTFDGTNPVKLDLRLKRLSASIHGTVTNAATGQPVKGVLVSASYWDAARNMSVGDHMYSDAAGRYELAVRAGTYHVYAADPRYDMMSKHGVVYDGVHGVQLDFPLQPRELQVSGVVRDAQTGLPVADAFVHSLNDSENVSAWDNTDASGRYEVWTSGGAGTSGPFKLRVSATGYRDSYITDLNYESPPLTQDFALAPVPPLATDAYEPDDTLGQASEVVPDGPAQDRTFSPQGDLDWIRLNVIAGVTYNISTYDYQGWPSAPELRLYAHDGIVKIAQSRLFINSEWDRGQVIEWTAPGSGVVYLQVTNWAKVNGISSPGGYGLQVVTNPPIAGTDRYETAVLASKRAFPTGASTVVMATGRDWPDALGGTALAGVLDGPVLLTDGRSVNAAVAAEIGRLGATRIVLLGGESAVSRDVEGRLERLPNVVDVERIAGRDRYETADKAAVRVIAEQGGEYGGTAFVATGGNFPDALAAAPLAAADGSPIYLAHPNPNVGLSSATKRAMAGVKNAVVLGGTMVVPAGVQKDLETMLGGREKVVRLAGSNRYETAVGIASYGVGKLNLRWNRTGISTGERFPDALAGGVVQGRAGSLMLLTRTTSLDPATAGALRSNKERMATVTYYGGPGALSSSVRRAVENSLR